MRRYLNILIFFLFLSSCSEEEIVLDTFEEEEEDTVEDIDKQTEDTDEEDSDFIKDILKAKGYDLDKFYVGATLNTQQLNTNVENAFLKEFSYSTVENSAKQSIVHPEPDVWKWERLDSYLLFAQRNNISIRIHGPVGPQSSKWAKNDSRTPNELLENMTDYMTNLSQRINPVNSVKWMDVVNETITTDGKWFGERPGDDLWENPWKQIGMNDDNVPIYILKSFEIANQYAKNVKLIFNQHGGMEEIMWEKVKKTIIYLRNKGYRIDGLGWQGHLKDNKKLSLSEDHLNYLSELIDWAHENNLEFHVTEIDYALYDDPPSTTSLDRQANGYSNILKLLINKMNNGVVTFNTWGMIDKTNQYKFILDKNLNPKPALIKLRETLKNKSTDLVILD